MRDLDGLTESCRLLGDVTRVRLLSVLSAEELSVAELTDITGLAQSRVSTHLGLLRDAGWLKSRRQGGSTFYALAEPLPDDLGRLWKAVRETTRDALLTEDVERARKVVAERQGATWADTVAGRMAQNYSPGRTWESALRAIIGLVRLGRVLDVASGDGAIAELLAPRAETVTCLDASERVVSVGRRRLAHLSNLTFVEGDLHALPFPDASFDQVLMMSALDYAADPALALREAARVLSDGGTLVAATLRAHGHEAVVAPYNHVQRGFEPDRLESMLAEAGFEVSLCAPTSRERRPPHFEVVTVHVTRRTRLPPR